MRSLQLLLVILMMTLSATDVVAQKSVSVQYETLDGKLYQRVTPVKEKKTINITYVDGAKPEIPGYLIGEYLENGEVSVLGEKEVIGYVNFIFSLQTTQKNEVWKRSGYGVVYVQSSLLGQEVAWWMILAVIGIFSMIIAQISKNKFAALIAFFIAFSAAAFTAVATTATVIVALAFFVALFATLTAFIAFIAALFATLGGNKTIYIIYYVGMIFYIVAMYFAF